MGCAYAVAVARNMHVLRHVNMLFCKLNWNEEKMICVYTLMKLDG